MRVITEIKTAVQRLFQELESISNEYPEFTDTDVREAVHLALNCGFVWGRPLDPFPVSFRMFSEEGDRRVANAVREFLDTALPLANSTGTDVGQRRLELLQDESLNAPGGTIYDELIGHRDSPLPPDPLPRDMYMPGSYGNKLGGAYGDDADND